MMKVKLRFTGIKIHTESMKTQKRNNLKKLQIFLLKTTVITASKSENLFKIERIFDLFILILSNFTLHMCSK